MRKKGAIRIIVSFTSSFKMRLHRKAECSRDLTTLMYESLRDVYLPTRTMETDSKRRSCLGLNVEPTSCYCTKEEIAHPRVSPCHRVARSAPRSVIAFGILKETRSRRFCKKGMMPWDRRSSGTWYTDETSCTLRTCSCPTWQNMESFSFVEDCSGPGPNNRHAIYRSG